MPKVPSDSAPVTTWNVVWPYRVWRGPSPAFRKYGFAAPGQCVVGTAAGFRVRRVRWQVLHAELALGRTELVERRRARVDLRVGRAGVRRAGEVEEAVPARRRDRSHELRVVTVELVRVDDARRHAGDVARVEDAALAIGPDLDAAADAEEEVVLLVVLVKRNRTPRRPERGHHRHRTARLF